MFHFKIGEQPNPWDLLQPQDVKSRHRGAKRSRRCELLETISLFNNVTANRLRFSFLAFPKGLDYVTYLDKRRIPYQDSRALVDSLLVGSPHYLVVGRSYLPLRT
jgi:hypothetical protein